MSTDDEEPEPCGIAARLRGRWCFRAILTGFESPSAHDSSPLRARSPLAMTEPASPSTATELALVDGATAEVDTSLLDWYRELSVVERLRAASRAAATLDRLAHAASKDR